MTHLNFAMTTLLNGIWEGTLLAATMWLFLKLFPRLNPTTRFTVQWVTLLAVVVLPLGPLASRVLPHAAPAGSHAAAATIEPATATLAPAEIQHPIVSHKNAKPVSQPHRAVVLRTEAQPLSNQASETVATLIAASQPVSPAIMPVQQPLIRIHSAGILSALEIGWALLSFVMLARLSFGFWKLRKLKALAEPALAEWQLRLSSLSRMNNVRRQTQLFVSSRIAAPMSLGFFHPGILIPQTLIDTLSDSELEHVVLHELAHLRRRDDWTNLAQKVIEAILPIQPAIYWVGHQMSLEREMACDDWVIAATGTAEPYAASLARVAELSQWRHAGILAAGATGNRSQLFSRVHHMLDRTRNAAPKLALRPLVAAIAAAGVLLYVGARTPQMIAFAQNTTHEMSHRELIATNPPHPVLAAQTPLPVPAQDAVPALRTPVAQVAALSSASSSELPGTPPSPPSPPSPRSPLAAVAPLSRMSPIAAEQTSETHMEMTTRNGVTSLSVKIDGAIEFTDDDSDVKSLSPGGHFRIEGGSWLSGRAYDVKADSAGNLTKTYSVGMSTKPMDAEGRVWLARLMPQMIRDSGVGAERRVARILRQGGPPAVITEIGLIHSDGSKRIYIEQLFAQASLNTEQLKESARLIRGISSDGDKAQVLTTVDEKYFNADLRGNLFDAVASISSDGDKRRVLSDILNKDAGNTDTLLSVARTAEHISSDGDKAQVLVQMAEPYRATGGVAMAYFEATKSVSSDGDHARVLLAMLAAHGDNRDTLARVLRSAQKISSDGDKARVLKEAVVRYSDDETIRKAFIDAANSISSDGDHQQVLVVLVHRQGNTVPTLDGIAQSAQRISSDGDKARVLVELAATNVEPVSNDFFAAADSINSDGDHSRVLTTVLDRPGTSTTTAIAAIQSATRISSDGDKARVLMEAADKYPKDSAVNSALRKAVESLHSDGEYRSVMSELSRHEQSR